MQAGGFAGGLAGRTEGCPASIIACKFYSKCLIVVQVEKSTSSSALQACAPLTSTPRGPLPPHRRGREAWHLTLRASGVIAEDAPVTAWSQFKMARVPGESWLAGKLGSRGLRVQEGGGALQSTCLADASGTLEAEELPLGTTCAFGSAPWLRCRSCKL